MNNQDKKTKVIQKAQAILAAYLPPDGVDAKQTISNLLMLLDGPESREALADGQQLEAVTVDTPLTVFSAGVWTYRGTGQNFDAEELNAEAFSKYQAHTSAAVAAERDRMESAWRASEEARSELQAAAAAVQAAVVPEDKIAIELQGVQENISKGYGFWSTCSGCHETEDGHSAGAYPYSKLFKCELGSGCSECGGIGAIWDINNYGEMYRTAPSAAPVQPASNSCSNYSMNCPADAAPVEAVPFVPLGYENETEFLRQQLKDARNFIKAYQAVISEHEATIAAQATPAKAVDERAAFEAWCYDKHPVGGPDRGLSKYANSGTQKAWEGWQARAALAPSEQVKL